MMKTTNDAARTAARAKLNASRRKMAAFVMAQTGTTLDAEATIDGDDNVVVSGAVAEVALVAAYFRTVLLVDGVVLEEPMAEDPDWTCVRIPSSGVVAAIWTCVRIPSSGVVAAISKHKAA